MVFQFLYENLFKFKIIVEKLYTSFIKDRRTLTKSYIQKADKKNKCSVS